jgi:SSS family solute:Na+ symporter
MALVAGVYITAGGLEAVVLNDALQALLILAGGSLIALLAWNQVPGWDAVREATPDKALHLFLPPDDPVMPWPGILSGVLVVGLYFWCTNQFMIQRALATKSLREGRKGSIFAGFLKLPNLFILIIPGVLAKYLYPELERPDLVFPVLALDILPQGVRGIILAALAAAILSSLESIYNSAATLFTRDFLRHRFPKISEKGEVRAGQAATLVFMVVSALWAPWITEFPTLWQYLQSILSYLTPPVVAVFLGGMFWKGATDRGARYALLGGIPIGMAGWIANEVMGLLDIQYLYASGIMFVLGWLFMIAGSILPGGVKGKDETVFQQGDWIDRDEEGKKVPWYRSYIAYGMLLALVAGTIVWIWR